MKMGGAWVLEVDIKSFFDDLQHDQLRDLLRRRVRDGVIHRLIGKWLNAGVLTGGSIERSEQGTPQGGVISPLLANVYLHEVLDVWFEEIVRPRLRGRAFLVRYADDFVIAFAHEEDARRVLAVLPKRFGKFGLTLHPEKTKLLDFRRPPRGTPESFDLLGFTHYWSRSRKGNWIVKKKTAKSRLCRSLRRMRNWCHRHRHWKVADQHRAICRSVKGHYAYYGITGNIQALQRFRRCVERIWVKYLRRRSQRAHSSWVWHLRLRTAYPLPPARIVHSIYRVASP